MRLFFQILMVVWTVALTFTGLSETLDCFAQGRIELGVLLAVVVSVIFSASVAYAARWMSTMEKDK